METVTVDPASNKTSAHTPGSTGFRKSHGVGRRLGDLARSIWLPVIVLFLLVGAWDLSLRVFDVPPTILPSPAAVWRELLDGLSSGALIRHSIVTLEEIIYGFVIGSIIGIIAGVLIAEVRVIRRALYIYVVAFQAIPKVALAPLFLIWFGFGLTSKVLLTLTMVFFPILVNTIQGLNSANTEQLELLKAYCAGRWQIFFRVRLPTAIPYIFAGLEIAVVLSVIGAIVAEFVSAKSGLGYIILRNNLNLDMAGVFAALAVLGVIGILLSALVKLAHRKIVYWEVKENN